MAAHERSKFPQPSYRTIENSGTSNIFYENVKKDSEIQLTDQQAQELIHKAEIHSAQGSYNPSTMVHSPSIDSRYGQTRGPTVTIPDSNASKLMIESVSPGPSQQQQSVSSTNMDCSLEPVNKVLEAQSDNYKRLSQSDKTHTCMTCYKAFRNKPQLTQHELVHNNVRKHVCTYCDKAFKQISHLNQHIRVHTGEQPYKCDVDGCGRSFAQLSNLNHHKKNHEEHVKREVSRQYRCDICERSYATNQSLLTHIQKLHTNLKAAEGSVSHPLVGMSTVKKPRKPKSDNRTLPTMVPDPFVMECDSEDINDHDLPTQVKVKPRYSATAKPNLPVRTGTPPGDRDKGRPAPRTSLPLPLAFTQGSPLPLDVRGQPGHESFMSSLSDTNHPIHQGSFPQQIYTHSVVNMSHTPQTSSHNGKPLVEAHQRELMQASLHENSDKGYLSLKLSQAQQTYSASVSSSADRRHVSPQPPEAHHVGEAPTHITHHYPKQHLSDSPSQRPESQNIFNPAFSTTDPGLRPSDYRTNQY